MVLKRLRTAVVVGTVLILALSTGVGAGTAVATPADTVPDRETETGEGEQASIGSAVRSVASSHATDVTGEIFLEEGRELKRVATGHTPNGDQVMRILTKKLP